MLEKLRVSMPLHHLPIMVLGSGRTTLRDKFSCVLFAFLLESSSSCEAFATYFGVEFGLSSILPMSIRTLFPWFHEFQLQQDGREDCYDDDEGFNCMPDLLQDSALDTEVSLQESIACPGLLHIVHNAANDLLDVMKTIGFAVDQLVKLAAFPVVVDLPVGAWMIFVAVEALTPLGVGDTKIGS